MTTTINWPSYLPAPAMAPYQIKPVPNLRATEVDTGPARQRKTSIASRDLFTLQFEATLWQQMLFESWHRNVAQEGGVWFNIPLLGGIGIVPHEARFKAGQDPTYAPRNGQNWLISCTVEVRDRPMLTAADLAIFGAEDPATLFAAIAAFDALMASW